MIPKTNVYKVFISFVIIKLVPVFVRTQSSLSCIRHESVLRAFVRFCKMKYGYTRSHTRAGCMQVSGSIHLMGEDRTRRNKMCKDGFYLSVLCSKPTGGRSTQTDALAVKTVLLTRQGRYQ